MTLGFTHHFDAGIESVKDLAVFKVGREELREGYAELMKGVSTEDVEPFPDRLDDIANAKVIRRLLKVAFKRVGKSFNPSAIFFQTGDSKSQVLKDVILLADEASFSQLKELLKDKKTFPLYVSIKSGDARPSNFNFLTGTPAKDYIQSASQIKGADGKPVSTTTHFWHDLLPNDDFQGKGKGRKTGEGKSKKEKVSQEEREKYTNERIQLMSDPLLPHVHHPTEIR